MQSLSNRLCRRLLTVSLLAACGAAQAQQNAKAPVRQDVEAPVRKDVVGQLERLFDVAEQCNSALHSSQSAVETAKATYDAARASVLPDIEAQLSVSYNGNGRVWDRDFSNGHTAPIPHFGNGAGLRVSLPVYTGGAQSSAIALTRQGVQMAEINQEASRGEVRWAVTRLYLMLHTLANRCRVYDEHIRLARQTTELMRQRCREGVVLENDVTRYELLTERLLLGRTKTANQQSIVGHQLNITLGTDVPITLLNDSAFSVEALGLQSEADWQLLAHDHAYALQRAQLAVDMSREHEHHEQAALLPSVAVVAEDVLTGPVTIEIPAMNNNFNYWYVGVGVKYNVSSIFKDNRKVRQARRATQQARDAQCEAADQTNMAVQAAYTDFLTALSALDTHRKSVQLAAQNYEVVLGRYQNGLALITDLIDAANERLSAELQLIDARIQIVENYYNIKYQSGTL